MIFNRTNRLLRSADPDATGSGSSIPAAPLAALPDPVAAVEAEVKPGAGFLASVLASVSSKATLVADRDTYQARAAAAEKDLDEAQTELFDLRAELKTLKDERIQIEKALTAATDANTTTEAAAAVIVAGLGFQASALPAAETIGNSIEDLEAKLGAETDPKEIVRLNQQLEARKAALKN